MRRHIMNFIKSSDKETIEELKNCGFTLLFEKNGFATFLNDSKLTFSSKKAVYSNKMEL